MFNTQIAYGLLIPFLGTMLGSACVFVMKKQMSLMLERILEAFAAGVMVAASVWSLLIPALEHAEGMGKLSFIPAAVGFWAGILLLLLLDEVIQCRDGLTGHAADHVARRQRRLGQLGRSAGPHA